MCSLKLNERFIKRLAELTHCTHIVQGFNSLYTYRSRIQLIIHIYFKESTHCTHIFQRINSLYTYRLMNQLSVHISFKESTHCTHIV